MRKGSCSACRYWDRIKKFEGGRSIGRCRRNPPIGYAVEKTNDDTGDLYLSSKTVWLTVNDSWCEEFAGERRSRK